MSNIMEVCSTAEDVNKNNNFVSNSVVNVSENVQKCHIEEAYNTKNYINVEKNAICNIISQNEEDCNCKNCSGRNESGVNSECSNEDNITTYENEKIKNENDIAYDNRDAKNDNIYEKTLSKRILDLIDEDSNDEIISCKKNLETNKTRNIINSESEEDLQTNDVEDIPQTIYKIVDSINSYQSLLDSDSEENKKEIPGNFFSYNNANILENKNVKQKSKKKKQNSIRVSKKEAMHKIYSESQRLMRETDISLPYHKPKQRTLQEFLNRRKLSAAFSKTSSTTTKLKISPTIISKVLAEKEKEVERFYKSSDSEDDAQLVFSDSKNIEQFSVVDKKVLSRNVEFTHLEDSQTIGVSNKSLLDFDSFRVSIRKDLDQRDEDKKISSLFLENSVNKDNKFKVSSIQEISEFMQDNRRISRRLFENIENNTDQVSDVTHNQQEETPEIGETVITSIDDRKYINKKTSKVNKIDRVMEISNSQQCDSDVTNKQSKSLDNVNIKHTTETLETSNDVATNSNDCIIIENGNNESKEKCNETDNVSSSSFISINDTLSETQINCLIENFKNNGCVLGLPLPQFTDDILTNRKRFLPESLSNSKVRLKGSSDMIINLTEDVKSSQKNVNTLLNRFFSKHAVTKKQPDSKSEVTVIHLEDTLNGPFPVKETLPYKISIDIDNSELSKPGAKLMRLKEDLKLQMIMKRNKEWKQKEIERQYEEKWNKEDEDDYELVRDSLDEQKQPLYTIDSDSEESELEENDVEIKEKKRRVCLFADDEAEVTNDDSNIEMYAENDAEDSSEQSMNFKRKRESDISDENDISDMEINKEEKEEINEDADIEDDESKRDSNKSDDNVWKNKEDRRTKRSIHDFQDEDSNITVSNYVRSDSNHLKNITTKNENDMPVYQQAEVVTRTQECKTPFAKTSMLDFISPVTQLSVLNTIIDSAKKDSSKIEKRSDDKSFFVKESIQNISKSSEQMSGDKIFVKKKLFDDTEETIDDEYLMQLCSGKFRPTQNTALDLKDFSSQFNDVKQSENSRTENETSQNATTIDKDFDNSGKRTKDNVVNKELKLTVISSDDEEHSDETDMVSKLKKRPLRRLNLSDSEEENAESFDEKNSDKEQQYVDYDSEENEVIVPEKDIKKIAACFVEQEAELSESDWDSADEDEKDLDKLDFEEGDNEQLNEHEIRDQLGKMHMKQMLDEDKRNVRLLKELLFEDGDLYTDVSSRERKFKWRNIEKLGSNIETSELLDGQDWIDEQDHEEEAKWYKLRQERDKFLEEKMKSLNNKLEDELCDSQIFKPFKRIKDTESQKQSASPSKADLSETIDPIMPRNITDLLNGPSVGKKSQMIYNITKKSSFLNRGEKSLAKIASLAKQCDSVSHPLNTRNFVFQYISPSTESSSKKDKAKELDLKNESRKRKTTSNCSSTTKKRRK
ncbi:claspin [Pseudomyrmex gracilis]|uniref:claspin n=1 Tax=Pseudomyrmex gracilis TaxID=219809 RepID=UPI000994B84A|nr:claspin [Pseudomyrmex gracilis]